MLKLAVIGAGPAGLSLALEAAQALPDACITVFDARPAEQDVSGDPRTLALSLGSVQSLQRLGVWDGIEAAGQVASITTVHVSQQQPALVDSLVNPLLARWLPRLKLPDEPTVVIRAVDEGVPRLGAVLSYGALVAPLQAAWLAREAAQDAAAGGPRRLSSRFGTRVKGFKTVDGGVEVDAGIAEVFDLAVVAEGGVFADQPPKSWPQGISRDYRQTAWVGQVRIRPPAGATAEGAGADAAGLAYERFTPQGPAALLPLPARAGDPPGERRAALVWCVNRDDDPVAALDEVQRLALLNTVFHPEVGSIVTLSPLKAFALGLNAEWRLVQRGGPQPAADAGRLGPLSPVREMGGLGRLAEPPRIVRIGNAAQTLHPVAGQGLNLGLRDVHVLVESLAQAFDGAAPPVGTRLAAALRRFEWKRTPDRWALIGATDFLARSFTWAVPALATLRGVGLAALEAAGPAKSALARRMMFGQR